MMTEFTEPAAPDTLGNGADEKASAAHCDVIAAADVLRFSVQIRSVERRPAKHENKRARSGPAVRIYKPSPNPMQSGRANTRFWLLEFERHSPPFIEPLMGWTGSRDTLKQVRIKFPTREGAIAFADRQGYAYTVVDPPRRRLQIKSYADTLMRPPERHRRREAKSGARIAGKVSAKAPPSSSSCWRNRGAVQTRFGTTSAEAPERKMLTASPCRQD